MITDLWRAGERRPRLVNDDAALARAPSDDEVDRVVEAWSIADALGRLSPEHRAVGKALFFEDRSVADAAARLGVPEGTVKSRSYYAVRALRAACEEMGVLR